MRQDRDGCIQARRADAFSDQKAKEHAKSRRARFRCCQPPPLTVLLEDKLSQTLSVKPFRILSKVAQQRPNGDAVVVEGQIAGSTFVAHPLTECSEQNWLLIYWLGNCCDYAGTSKVPKEKACTSE